MKPERKERINTKNTGTCPQKISPRESQRTTNSYRTDLERAIEKIIPPTTNVMIHYRVMKERLLNKFGPNSQKDAEEARRKLESLHGDHRGWDIYLATLDALIEVLTKTPVRDTTNNPVMQSAYTPDNSHSGGLPRVQESRHQRGNYSSTPTKSK